MRSLDNERMNSPPRRSWIPRPLTAVLWGVFAVALALLAWGYAYAQQRTAAIRYAEAARGSVIPNSPPPWWPAALPHARWLWPVESIDMFRRKDCDLRHIRALSEVSELSIGCEIGEVGFRDIRSFTKLEVLNAPHARISHSGIRALKECRRLRTIILGTDLINDEGLGLLVGLPVEGLYINNAPVTDEGLKHLASLPLKGLKLRNTKVTDEGLKSLRGLPLFILDLGNTEITDRGIQELVHLPLHTIYLDSTAVTARGLRLLEGVPHLEIVVVSMLPPNDLEVLRTSPLLKKVNFDARSPTRQPPASVTADRGNE